MPTVRIKYVKESSLKCLSHLEVMRTVERSVRRAELPFVLTAGNSPHLKIAYCQPLPVGYSSCSEFFDLELTRLAPLKDLIKSFNRSFPKGLSVAEARYIPPRTPSLSSQTTAAGYRVHLEMREEVSREEIEAEVQSLLAQEVFCYEHKGATKEIALKEAIFDLAIDDLSSSSFVFHMVLSSGSSSNIRPEQVLASFDFRQKGRVREICRTGLYARRGAELLDLISL